jgi:hypothetical protein
VAKKAKVPFLTLKVISDPAEVRLPTAFLDRQSSHLSLFRVLATLGSKPWHWGNMLRLSRCTWRALARLSSIAKKLDLDFMPPAKATRRREAVS